MSIKPLSKTPRLVRSLADEGSFIKALYNALAEVNSTVNAILANLQANAWTAAALLGSWTNYDSDYAPAGYMLDAQGFVHLRGAVKSGSGVIFTLPSDFRPAYTVSSAGMGASNAPCLVTVAANGNVTVGGGDGSFVSLDGISFKAAT